MANMNNARKTFTDLSNPQQLRELNRQFEWVWNQLLGGLSDKAFSNVGIRSLVKTVEKTVAQEIEAEEITTNILKAALAEMMVAQIGVAQIDLAQIVDLVAENAIFRRGEAGEFYADSFVAQTSNLEHADIGFGQLKDLITGGAIITEGTAGELYIERLAATNAMMLSAVLGKLTVKGEDGEYYSIAVSADGTLHTSKIDVSSDEIAAGETVTGKSIIEASANIGALNAQSIKGVSAILSRILTTALTAGKITAGDAMIASATIPTLYATSIKALGDHLDMSANKSVQIMVGKTGKTYRSETAPEEAEEDDLWVQPSTNYIFQKTRNSSLLPELSMDADGNMYYRYGDGETVYELRMDESGDLYIDSAAEFAVTISEDGVPLVWERVKDSDLTKAELKVQDDSIIGVVTNSPAFQATSDLAANTADSVADLETEMQASEQRQQTALETTVQQLLTEIGLYVKQDELETYLKVLIEGVRIGRNDSLYNVLVTNTGVNIRYDEDVVASFVKRQLTSPSVRIASPADQTATRCVMRVAADGGMMIVNEEAIV